MATNTGQHELTKSEAGYLDYKNWRHPQQHHDEIPPAAVEILPNQKSGFSRP
ncbi:hypothetical protein [Aeromonas hydrophila]|uniref:hypothetical protein n=1 Tax=Aeromonas TaxID=642 RepID=UPI003D1F7CFC